jgi:GT2 family glycosyltransferase
LDSDDYWFPEFAERVLDRLSREEKIFATVEGYVEAPDGTRRPVPFYRSRGYAPLFDLNAEAQFEFALEDNFISIFSVVPRDALLQAGGFNTNLRYGEDWDLWLRLLKNGYAARLISEPLRVYRRHPSSATSRHTAERAQNALFILSQYKDAVSPYRWQTARANVRKATARELLHRLGVLPLRVAP